MKEFFLISRDKSDVVYKSSIGHLFLVILIYTIVVG